MRGNRHRAPGKPHGVVSVAGIERVVDGFTVSTDRTFRLQLPERFTPEMVQRIKKDCDGIAAIFQNHPDEAARLLDAVVQNNMRDARTMAARLGLTEEAFRTQGGGLIGWVIAAVVVAVIVVTEGEAE